MTKPRQVWTSIFSLFLLGGLFSVKVMAVAALEVGFVTEVAVEDGVFRVLIPTATDSANVSNSTGVWTAGTAVENAFVASSTTGSEISIACPNDVAGFTFGTPAKQIGTIFYDLRSNTEISQAEAAASSGDYVRYLGFLCPYIGTGSIGSQFATGGNSTSITISGLVSPAAGADQDINEAVMIPGKIQLLKNGYTAEVESGSAESYVVSDRDVMISAFTKDVLITATINGQITFRINSISDNVSVCGTTTTVASAPTSIDFGAPLVNTFVDAAQQLQVVSSATGGYAVTVRQDSNMMRNGSATCGENGLLADGSINRDCIPNFGWSETTPVTATSGLTWTAATKTGFGYTVTKTNGNGAVGERFAENKYSRFPTGVTNDVAVVSSTTVSDADEGDVYDVCYRLSVDAQNNAGVYDNSVFYTITALF